jgi:hypothetical protein
MHGELFAKNKNAGGLFVICLDEGRGLDFSPSRSVLIVRHRGDSLLFAGFAGFII